MYDLGPVPVPRTGRKLYEEISKERLMEMHPVMRQMLGD